MKLTATQYAKAASFIQEYARPLEKAIYRYEFDGGAREDIERELKKYQNTDGGFGNAIEPDVRMPGSSVLGTIYAFQYIRTYQLSDREMISKALDYLRSQYQEDINGWLNVPAEVNNYPRAPWWNYTANPRADWGWGNPNAEVLAYLLMYGEQTSSAWLDQLSEYAITYLVNDCPLTEMHELLCYLRLEESLSAEQKARIGDRLDQFISNCVRMKHEHGSGYFLHPLQIAKSPSSPYYQRFASGISKELDVLIQERHDDGTWHPTWAWGQYEDTWGVASMELRGIFTLEALQILRNYDRLE